MSRQVEDYPCIEITIRAYNTLASEITGGEGIMTFTTFPTEVYNGERSQELDGNGIPVNKIGNISGGLGFVIVSGNENNPDGAYYFMIQHKDLWEAITRELRERSGKDLFTELHIIRKEKLENLK